MRNIKIFLCIFLASVCINFVSVQGTEIHTFIAIKIPALAKKYTSDVTITKQTSTKQYIYTKDSADVVTGKKHSISARIIPCLNSSKDATCTGENAWVVATTGSKVALTNSNQPGYFKLQLKTTSTQAFETEYWGTWYYE